MSPEKQQKIEKKKAKRAVRQEQWKQTAPAEVTQRVNASIEAGIKRATARKERARQEKAAVLEAARVLRDARDRRLEKLKPGREFNKTNKPVLFKGEIFGYPVIAGALLCTGAERSVYYAVTYAICSPRDIFSFREGCDRVGMRFLEVVQGNAPQYSFEIKLSKRGALSPVRLAMLINAHIVMDVVTHRVRFPERMERVARMRSRRGWGWGNCLSPLEVKKRG